MLQPSGRERRRTDIYGRARRLMYGLLLLAASPGAMASDPMAELGRYTAAVRDGLRMNMAVTDVGQVHVKLNRSPEVRLEFLQSANRFKPMEVGLKYDRGAGLDGKVPQLSMKWRL